MYLTNSQIKLNDLRFHGCHGVSEAEQRVGSDFNLCLSLDVHIGREALEDDQLSSTVNYAEVYETIRREFSIPAQLLEHVAWRISQALFDRFERIEAMELTLEKLNPPMSADCKSAAVRLSLQRKGE